MKDLLKLRELIKVGNLSATLTEVNKISNWDLEYAVKCLVDLQILLHKRDVGSNASVLFAPLQVYNLADLCCCTIKKCNYKENATKFLTCLYFIIKYLIEKNEETYAKNLCIYIKEMKQKTSSEDAQTKAYKTVTRNIYQLFCVYICNADVQSMIELEENDEDNLSLGYETVIKSLIELWKFAFSLREGDVENISDFIVVLVNFIKKFGALEKNILKYVYTECIPHIFSELNLSNREKSKCDIGLVFNSYIKLLAVSIVTSVKFKNTPDFILIFESITNTQNIFNSGDQSICLTFCYTFINCLVHFLMSFALLPSSLLKCNSTYVNLNFTDILNKLQEYTAYKVTGINKGLLKEVYSLILLSCKRADAELLLIDKSLKIKVPAKCIDKLSEFLYIIYEYPEIKELKLCDDSQCKTQHIYLHKLQILSFIMNSFRALYRDESLHKISSIHSDIIKGHELCLHWIKLLSASKCPQDHEALVFVVKFCIDSQNIIYNMKNYSRHVEVLKEFLKWFILESQTKWNKLLPKLNATSLLASYCYSCNILGTSDGFVAVVLFSIMYCKSDDLKRMVELVASSKLSRHISAALMNIPVYKFIKDDLQKICADWNVDESIISSPKWLSLISLEIQVYHSKKSLQGDPLLNSFNSLKSIADPTTDFIVLAKALIYVLKAITNNILAYDVDEWIMEVDSVIGKLMKKKNKTTEEQCILGNVLHYKVRFEIHIKRKNIKSMLIKCTGKEMPIQIDPTTGLAIDPMEVDDTVVVDSALLFSNQEPLMQKLDTALLYLRNGLINQGVHTSDLNDCSNLEGILNNEDIIYSDNLSQDVIEMSLCNINATAQLYRLHSENCRALNAWLFLYKISRHKYPDVAIDAFTNLLGLDCYSDLETDLIKQLYSLLENNCPSLDQLFHSARKYIQSHFDSTSKSVDINSDTLNDVYKKFFIQLARYLHKSCCEKSEFLINQTISYTNNLTYLNYLSTVGELLSLNCKVKQDNETKRASHVLNQAFSFGRNLERSNSWNNYIEQCNLQRIILETANTASTYFLSVSIPRRACMYLREELLLPQKLVLPLWTCKLLIALSWIEISQHKLVDTELKLRNVEVILGLKFSKDFRIKHESFFDSIIASDSPTYSKLDNSNTECLKSTDKNVYSDSSITPLTKNVESLCIVVDVVILRGIMFYLKKLHSQSAVLFDFALQLMSTFKEPQGQCTTLKNWLLGRNAIMNYYRATMLCFSNNHASSLNYCNEALKCFQSNSVEFYSYNITRNSVLLLRSSVAFYNVEKPHSSNMQQNEASVPNVKKSQFTGDSSSTLAVTPPARCSSIPIRVTPLSYSKSTAKPKNSVLSPGDFATNHFAQRKLFTDEDESDDNELKSSVKCSVKEKNKPASSKSKALKSVSGVKEITKSFNSINIYNDELDNITKNTPSLQKNTKGKPKPKGKHNQQNKLKK